MKDNEYLEYGENKEIEEYQRFEAVEYYKVKETAQSPFENYDTSEENNSSYTNNNTNTKVDDERERLDRLEKMQSQDAEEGVADGGTTTSTSTTTSSTSTTTTTAATSTGASASVTSTSAVLVATSVITVAAVAVIATSALVLNIKPNIDLVSFDVGCNYVLYDMNVTNLDMSYTWDVKVSNDSYTFKEVISEDGNISNRLIDLTPGLYYTLEVEADLGDYGYKTFYSKSFITSNDKKPKASFDIDVNPDYENGFYPVMYNIYVSDYNKESSNTRLEVYFDKELYYTDYEINDSYFLNTISDVADETTIGFKCYTTYKGNEILIGEYEYEVDYPDDFVKPYKASYNVLYNATYDVYDGTILTVETGFDNSADINDYYLLELYDGDEVIASYEGVDSEVKLNIDLSYKNAVLCITQMKNENGHITAYETEEVASLSFDPRFIESAGISISYNNISCEGAVFEKYSEYSLYMSMTTTYKDGTSTTVNGEEPRIFVEGEYDSEQEIESILFELSNDNGKVIDSYLFDMTSIAIENKRASNLEYVVDYNLTDDSVYTIDSGTFVYDNVTYEMDIENKNMIISTITNPKVLNLGLNYTLHDSNRDVSVMYNNVTIETTPDISYDLDYMLMPIIGSDSSNSTRLYYKVIPTIEGEQVNVMNWTASILENDSEVGTFELSDGYRYESATISGNTFDYSVKYYSAEVSDKVTYTIPVGYSTDTRFTETSIPESSVRTYNLDDDGNIISANVYYRFDIDTDEVYKVVFAYLVNEASASGNNCYVQEAYYLSKTNNTVVLKDVVDTSIMVVAYEVERKEIDGKMYDVVIYPYDDGYITLTSEANLTALAEGSYSSGSISLMLDENKINMNEFINVSFDNSTSTLEIHPMLARNSGSYDEDNMNYSYSYEEEYDGNSLSIVLTDNLESLSITITYNNEYASYENVIVKICECAYLVNDLINDGTSIEGTSYIYVNNTDSSVIDSNNNILVGVLDGESGYMKYQYSGAYVYTTVKNMIQV